MQPELHGAEPNIDPRYTELQFLKTNIPKPQQALNPKPPTSYLAAVPEVVVADAVLTVVEDVVLLHTGIYKGFLKGIYTV